MLQNFKLEDLKTMQEADLKNLASEIRQVIIDTCSKNGGHISSNLGVVELTIALHKVFNTPFDKIIFDVSHQTYTHKILTGRYDKFDTLRKFGGLSGFTKMNESEYDCFEAGHSSTSISAGLGLVEARKQFPDKIGDIITVIGDASVSNGLAFEALNYLGDHKEDKMIVIINDNNMSVSRNVGALARRYNKLRVKKSLKILKKLTPVRIKHALQYYAYRVDLFTSMGFKYFENIDGHDFNELIRYLTFAKKSDKSIILHIKTTKGKGYEHCEKDEVGNWHGVGPFNKETGEFLTCEKGISFGSAIASKLGELIDSGSDNIRVISPAMILGSGLKDFSDKHPNKIIDVGIAEENAVVMASSMAISGLIPVVFIYSTFLQRAYDEILHDCARTSTHVVFCVDRAGIVAHDGSTHQGIYDVAFLSTIPGITILQPVTINDAKAMIDDAVNKISGPVVIRYPKGSINFDHEFYLDYTCWNEIRSGSNYVITYGTNLIDVLNNVDESIGVIYAPNLTNIDQNLLNKITGNIYVYEDVIRTGSLYSRILDYKNIANLNFKLYSVSIEDGYLTEGSVNELKEAYHVSVSDLKDLINKTI